MTITAMTINGVSQNHSKRSLDNTDCGVRP
jgi:hypothetical protein